MEKMNANTEEKNAKIDGGEIKSNKVAVKISRDRILAQVENMRKFKSRYPIAVNIKARKKEFLPDYLLCGDRSFAIIYEYNKLIHYCILLMGDEAAQRLSEKHIVKPYRNLVAIGNWYKIDIDNSFASDRDVYNLLNESYDFVYDKYYLRNEASEVKAEALKAQAAIEAALSAFPGQENKIGEKILSTAAIYKEEGFADETGINKTGGNDQSVTK